MRLLLLAAIVHLCLCLALKLHSKKCAGFRLLHLLLCQFYRASSEVDTRLSSKAAVVLAVQLLGEGVSALASGQLILVECEREAPVSLTPILEELQGARPPLPRCFQCADERGARPQLLG